MNEEIAISKALSFITRHGATKHNIPIRSDGFVLVADLKKYKKLKNVTLAQIQHIVSTNSKQRFTLICENQDWFIKANQGHSLDNVSVELKTIKHFSELQCDVIHGTYDNKLESILKDGLKPMGRQHIHFAAGNIDDEKVISGYRSSCQVLIYIDVEKAMNDGIVFYISPNNVILSSGIDGVIDAKYFSKVTDRKGNIKK